MRLTWLLVVLPFLLAATLLSLFAGELEKRGLRNARYAAAEETSGATLEAEAKDNEAAAGSDLSEASALQGEAAKDADEVAALEADAGEKAGVVGEDGVAAAESAGEAAAVEEVPGVNAVADAVKGVEAMGELSTAAGAAASIMKDETAAAREGAEGVIAKREAAEKESEAAAAQESAAAEEAAADTAEAAGYESAIGAAVYFAVAEVVRLLALLLEVPMLLGIAARWAQPYVAALATTFTTLFSSIAGKAGSQPVQHQLRLGMASGLRKYGLCLLFCAFLLDAWCASISTAAALERASIVSVSEVSAQISDATGQVAHAVAGRRLMDMPSVDPSFVSVALAAEPGDGNSTAKGVARHAHVPGPLLHGQWAMLSSGVSAAFNCTLQWGKALTGCAKQPLVFLMLADAVLGVLAATYLLGWRHLRLSHILRDVKDACRRWLSIITTVCSLWLLTMLLAVELQPHLESLKVQQYSTICWPLVWSATGVATAAWALWHAWEAHRRPQTEDHGTAAALFHPQQKLTEPLLPTGISPSKEQRLSTGAVHAVAGSLVGAASVAVEALESPISAWAIGSSARNVKRCWPLLLLCPWQTIIDEAPMLLPSRESLVAVALFFATLACAVGSCVCKGNQR